MQTQISITDVHNNRWLIPAELLETKFKRHQFAVHKSLSLEDNIWVVTHVATNSVLAHAASKEAAIAASLHTLGKMTRAEMDRAEELAYLERGRLLSAPSVGNGDPVASPGCQVSVCNEESEAVL